MHFAQSHKGECIYTICFAVVEIYSVNSKLQSFYLYSSCGHKLKKSHFRKFRFMCLVMTCDSLR